MAGLDYFRYLQVGFSLNKNNNCLVDTFNSA